MFDYANYVNTTLHTNYNYLRPNELLQAVKNNEKIVGSILPKVGKRLAEVRAKERAFYNAFGCKTDKSFIKALREIFIVKDGQMSIDAQMLMKASNLSVAKEISKIVTHGDPNKTADNVEYKFVFSTDAANKAIEKLTKRQNKKTRINNGTLVYGDVTFQIEGNSLIAFMPSSPNAIKTFMNKAFSKRFQKGKANTDALLNALASEESAFEIFRIDDGLTPMTNREFRTTVMYKPDMFGLTTDKMPTNDEKQRFIDFVLDYIRNYFANGAASSQYQQALDMSLRTLSANMQRSLKQQTAFMFAGGANWKNVLKGDIGEFGTILLFNYLNLIKSKNPIMATLVGNMTQNGEKLPVDVQVQLGPEGEVFGIQVKNLQLINNSSIKSITSKTNLNQLSQYTAFQDSNDVLKGFFANYFFNPKVHDKYQNIFDEMEIILEKYFTAELMNLAFSEEQVDNSVSFYNISNQYFVPGSVILKGIYDLLSENKKVLSITGPNVVTEYAKAEVTSYYHNGGLGESTGPNKFWIRQFGRWTPTAENKAEYNNLVNHNISFTLQYKQFFSSFVSKLADYQISFIR